MTDEISEEEIREKLVTHYGGDTDLGRELHKTVNYDNHDTVGSIFYSLDGSPPKGYGIYVPELTILSLYDHHGKRFRKMTNTKVSEIEK